MICFGVELAALGIATGFLAELPGIGGETLMAPAITLILSGIGEDPNLAVKMAPRNLDAMIIFTSISRVRAHHKRGTVRWDLVRGLTPGTVAGSMLGMHGRVRGAQGRAAREFLCRIRGPLPRRCYWTRSPPPRGRCKARQSNWPRVAPSDSSQGWLVRVVASLACPS